MVRVYFQLPIFPNYCLIVVGFVRSATNLKISVEAPHSNKLFFKATHIIFSKTQILTKLTILVEAPELIAV